MSKGKKPRGIPVKLSQEVINFLNSKKRRKDNSPAESYDSVIRRLFGLPTMKGDAQKLQTYFVLPNEKEPLIFLDKAEARGAAVIRAVRKGLRKAESVLTVREAP